MSEEDFAYLLEYAADDWVGLSTLVAMAGHALGRDATERQIAAALCATVSRLIEQGAVPGELTDGDPAFVPWPGSRERRVARLGGEIRRLGRLPFTGEVCWIHIPSPSGNPGAGCR